MRPSSLNAGRRRRELEGLADGEVVDVLVVGGGITGVGIALDAATRGLSVALAERGDLAQGTSRWSSKLVHGGLRYLAKGQIGLAHQSAVERGILMERTAPHLTRALAMVAPVGVASDRTDTGLTAGGFAAGHLLRATAGTRRSTLPPPRWLTSHETRLLAPGVRPDGLRGGLLGWDGQLTDDARLVVTVARTAAAFGSRILTRCRVEEVDAGGAEVVDVLTDQRLLLRARHVVNATGVWADRLHPEVALRPSKGAHLVVDAATLGHPRAALTVPVPGERARYVFALPQDDGRVDIGLTDDPVEVAADDPVADEADEAFLLSTLGRALERPLTAGDVVASYAGLRPLLEGVEEATSQLARDHAVLERDDGLVTVVGGKLTTYRRMAQDVVDRIAARDGVTAGPCRTARQPLVGAAPRARLRAIARGGDPALVRRHGTEAVELQELARRRPELAEELVSGRSYRRCELVWAVRHEGALTAEDLLDRRTRLGLARGRDEKLTALAEEQLAEHAPDAAG